MLLVHIQNLFYLRICAFYTNLNSAFRLQLGNVGPQVPHLFSPSIIPFVATLGAFEGLLVWYWVDLRLGQVLLYGAILSVPAAITGKRALAAVSERRLGKSSK